MSIMRPIELPDEVRKEPFRLSEMLFFDAAKNMDNDWVVLYGVSWYVKIRNNSWSEGEADFVVVSPQTGIVVIEVKGGQIGRDEDGWYSVDRNSEVHRTKDPSNQAANCKHKILQFIKTNKFFEDRFISARHMVCFPNASEKDYRNLMELPREMIIFSEDFPRLEKQILNFAKRDLYDQNTLPLTRIECQKIVEILKPNFNIPNRWFVQCKRQDAIIEQLTEEQNNIWEMFDSNKRISINGPAGSGKTLLAIKLARTILEEGGTVLALVPSVNLKTYYEEFLSGHQNFYCYTSPQFYSSEMSPPLIQFFPNLLVVDEAQDLSDEDWLCLYDRLNVEKIDRVLCVFDANQRLKKGSIGCPLESLSEMNLSKIIRNTKQIANFSSMFYTSDRDCKCVGPDGTKIQYTITDDANLGNEVCKAITHYVNDEGFDFADIVVLWGTQAGRTLKIKKNPMGISFRKLKSFTGVVYKQPIIATESVYGFRGLESKIIILCDIEKMSVEILDNICYVGASRARNILHIFASSETINLLSNGQKHTLGQCNGQDDITVYTSEKTTTTLGEICRTSFDKLRKEIKE